MQALPEKSSSPDRYVVYGDLGERDTAALATAMIAKQIPFEVVPESASLSWALASRAGHETGPYLRTPEGFVLAGTLPILDWLERVRPSLALLPGTATPVRRVCARLLEDWILAWLPFWPRRSWETVNELGSHLGTSGFLLGASVTRPDLLLAAWLESDVIVHEHARGQLAKDAPRLLQFGDAVLEANLNEAEDDVIPISLTKVLARMARDYHVYLERNQRAIKGGADHVELDLGFGSQRLPVRRVCEARRAALGRDLASLSRETRRDVRQVLEPVGAWHVLTLPPVLEVIDPSDPRSL